ncbi:hypothetical protein RV11_GL003176 [Enterococcus phoeniculicola]|uniref:DUF3991 domain-containing protein n=1 Tax=Enterococcus phoeniculicola ATCC BAA-412 TaxID=1158610 RepID=R3W618_9ENTE|nr:toprim domain-containing protein [Enterococcus phoeniculicola]EOL43007.1 hypothetical protein UC3_01984 [Enterococcus phoeniculicola ATCC BAA-412]EOT76635.1 hypothetical protein I589_01592 [Enterococcus phoeniculicola ATCC BAA-412]OJG72205.1 hypothetical protein RV11_GL003176 [Enterococcus phoeniculicola]
MKPKVFTERQLNYARATPVFDYLTLRGEKFESVGRHWRHTVHDSLTISKKTGVATWRSRSDCHSYNNAINFISEFYNEPYEQVVQSLLEFRSSENIQRVKYETKDQHIQNLFDAKHLSKLNNYDTNKLSERGRNYLRSRFLSEKNIDKFAAKHLISSDNLENVLFKIGDIRNYQSLELVGISVQGIHAKELVKRIKEDSRGNMKLTRKYFKGLALDSNPERGFLFGYTTSQDNPITLFVTESPIESLSLLELNKNLYADRTRWYLSTEGLKEQILWSTVKQLKECFPNVTGFDVVLAYNNDEKGRDAIRRIHSTYIGSENLKMGLSLKLLVPEVENGDWNEVLELAKTGQLATRNEKKNEKEKAEKIFSNQKNNNVELQEMRSME